MDRTKELSETGCGIAEKWDGKRIKMQRREKKMNKSAEGMNKRFSGKSSLSWKKRVA